MYIINFTPKGYELTASGNITNSSSIRSLGDLPAISSYLKNKNRQKQQFQEKSAICEKSIRGIKKKTFHKKIFYVQIIL